VTSGETKRQATHNENDRTLKGGENLNNLKLTLNDYYFNN